MRRANAGRRGIFASLSRALGGNAAVMMQARSRQREACQSRMEAGFSRSFEIANYSQLTTIEGRAGDCATDAGAHGFQASLRVRHRLAARARPRFARGSVRIDPDAAERLLLAEAPLLSWAGLSSCRRLYGSWQLGDVARRRLEIRLRAAHHRAVFQPDGDSLAGALRPARDRVWPGPRPGLP